jgi:hypothetical protein
MSEATIDIGMEHDADRCLDYYRDDVLPLFRSVQTEAVTDGIVEDLPHDTAAFADAVDKLTQLARESLRDLVRADANKSARPRK